MRQRFRSKLTFANIAASVALLVAVGGGTASAIIINGAPAGFNAVTGLQKARTVLGVPGVGNLTAACGRGGIIINYKNTTPQGQLVFADPGGSAQTTGLSLGPGQTHSIIVYDRPNPFEMAHIQAMRPGNGGTPMAQVGIVINFRGDCATTVVGAQSESSP